jgi:hypothetical protein
MPAALQVLAVMLTVMAGGLLLMAGYHGFLSIAGLFAGRGGLTHAAIRDSRAGA